MKLLPKLFILFMIISTFVSSFIVFLAEFTSFDLTFRNLTKIIPDTLQLRRNPTQEIIDGFKVTSLDGLLSSAKILPQISHMHRHYFVNCSAVFAGDEDEVKKINTIFLKPPAVPSDAEVADNWLGDCTKYRQYRDYPTRPWSTEEEEFPIAYSILTHKNAAQTERLLRSIYQPQNVYCIHVDLKAEPNFMRLSHYTE
ncbi:beta-1,3-galactosyl-O-glycosyl-glycoprotein beta-1,6-N-acetylglucosaminyltransferase-like [Amphiura filiformis]|uniref:beta-1,3-galactosyl-O-glycosyl-glycoprotein beta-1,6-N-acetylglucosaminyltransferase-like n=1 Tax=Amphiura filiformis TaxID=82378 RepID=UPI003B21D774